MDYSALSGLLRRTSASHDPPRIISKVLALMKTFNLSLATAAVGALAVSVLACSAQGQDNTQPRPSNEGGGAGPAGGASSGSAGSAAIPAAGSGTGGSPTQTGSAGSAPAGTGGGFNTGVGGALVSAGAPGTGAAGSSTGAAGSATTGGCKVAAGTATDLLIDDLEDGDNVIRPIGSRVGYWYTYNDKTTGAVQVPDPGVLFKATAGGSTATPLFAATTSGPAFTVYGAGMGFDFNNTSKKSCPYNASVYTGIKFWAKANTTGVSLKAMIKIPATSSAADGGTCATACSDHFFLKPAPVLTTTWTEYTLPFASIAQEGFGTPPATFDKANLLGVQFQVPVGVAFDFSVDDITFY